MLEMYKKLWSEVKNQIECNYLECNSTESIEYEKDSMKIKFDSYDDDLPLNKMIWISDLNIIVESVFQIKDKYYTQIQTHECECEDFYFFNDMINIKNFDPSLIKIDKKSFENIDIYNIGRSQ